MGIRRNASFPLDLPSAVLAVIIFPPDFEMAVPAKVFVTPRIVIQVLRPDRVQHFKGFLRYGSFHAALDNTVAIHEVIERCVEKGAGD